MYVQVTSEGKGEKREKNRSKKIILKNKTRKKKKALGWQ